MIQKLHIKVYMTYVIYDTSINTGYITCMYDWYKFILLSIYVQLLVENKKMRVVTANLAFPSSL